MAATSRKPRPPQGLQPGGRKLWNDIVGTYSLRPDEMRVLRDACTEADLVDDLQKALRKEGLKSFGSMGQPIVNPVVSELRQHRAVLAGLLRQLKLPDPAADGKTGGATETRATQARAAANARWARRGAS